MDLHDEEGGKVLIKITQNSSSNEKKVIDTKRSFGKANLLSSIITP